MSYRAEQFESTVKPDAQPAGVQIASSETGNQGFNNTYRQALASRNPSNAGLPDVTFVDGSNSIDYPAVQTGPKSFALGVDQIDARNGSLDQLGQKFDGIADGLTKSVGSQIQAMAEDPNAVNKGLMQLGGALETAFNYYNNKISNGDWNGFTSDIGQAGTAIKQASAAYDHASPNQQGEVIGTAMAMFLPVPALARETELANDATIATKTVNESTEFIEGTESQVERPPLLQFAENLGDSTRNLDPRERAYIKEKNISFTAVDRIQQINPDLPANAGGLCRTAADGGTEILISREVATKDIDYALRHEFGHAFDRTYLDEKRLSSLPGFEAAFQRDIANLTPEEQVTLRRYCADTLRGRRETLASMYAHSMGAPTDIERELLLKEKFPNTYNWVNGLVEAFKNEQI